MKKTCMNPFISLLTFSILLSLQITYAQCTLDQNNTANIYNFDFNCPSSDDYFAFYRASDSYFQSSVANTNNNSALVSRQFGDASHTIQGYRVTKNGPIDDDLSYHVTLNTTGNTNPTLPLIAIPNPDYLKLSTSWNAPLDMPTIDNDDYFYLIISFGGLDNDDSNGTINLDYSEALGLYDYIHAILPADGSVEQISDSQFTYSALSANRQKHIYVKFKRHQAFDWLPYFDFNASINSHHLNETTTLTTQVHRFPHDPNYITVDKPNICPCNQNQRLTYKVFFQNEGNGPAKNVAVDVNLGNHLLENNISNIQYSHPNAQLTTQISLNTLTVGLAGINLPGLKQTDKNVHYTYDQTIGWISFDVPVSNCVNSGQITSSAKIVFISTNDTPMPAITTDPVTTKVTNNMLKNGNFQNGDTSVGTAVDFTSDLDRSCYSNTPNSYCITYNMKNKGFPNDIYDHTKGNASGKMMVIDEGVSSTDKVWKSFQNLPVKQNHTYTFYFWAYVPSQNTTSSNNPLPEFNMVVGDQVVKRITKHSISTNQWQKHSATWTAPADDNIQLTIQEISDKSVDYALDDIYFSACVKSPYCCNKYQLDPRTDIIAFPQIGSNFLDWNGKTSSTNHQQMVNVFPNPFKEQINLQVFPNSSVENSILVELYNIHGQKVATTNIEIAPTTHPLDTSQLPNGIYFIKTQIYENTHIQKVIKQ